MMRSLAHILDINKATEQDLNHADCFMHTCLKKRIQRVFRAIYCIHLHCLDMLDIERLADAGEHNVMQRLKKTKPCIFDSEFLFHK